MNSKNKKTMMIILIAVFVSYLLSISIEYYDRVITPLPLRKALSESKNSAYVKKTIGEILSEGYTFNKNDLEGDSINYRFYLIGNKSSMSVRSHQKFTNGTWVVLKSDTSFSKN